MMKRHAHMFFEQKAKVRVRIIGKFGQVFYPRLKQRGIVERIQKVNQPIGQTVGGQVHFFVKMP